MVSIAELVKIKIEILRGYPFFNDFMNADLPDNQKFLDDLKAFSEDLIEIRRVINKKELKLLQHLIALSTYPKEKRYAMLERWLIAELTSEFISFELVKNPFGRTLKQFYRNIYQETFSEEEQEPLRKIKWWIFGENWLPMRIVHAFDKRFYKNIYGDVVHPRYYLIVVKIKGIVVGGAVVNTISTDKISFMVIDYILIVFEHLSKIEGLREFATGEFKVKMSTALFERCKYLAVKDAMRYGHKQHFFILGQVNDPVKMHRKGVLNRKYDTENPVLRLRLYSLIGFRFLDFPYVSPALEEGKEAIDYEYEMIYPFRAEWRNELDPAVYKYALITFLGTYIGADVNKTPVKEMSNYLDNLIREGRKIRLMNFADLGMSREFIKYCRQIRWRVED